MSEHLRVETAAGTFDAIGAGPEDGRGVLLLHGFPQAATAWAELVGVLGGAGVRAVAPDQRGYSPDVRPTDVADYRMDELVADALAIADALGWPVFDLVGHDWGAVVGWHLAADHPERLRTLTAVSVPHPAALAQANRTDEEQHTMSGYVAQLRAPTAERQLLAEGATALRRIFDHQVPASHIDDYVARLSEPGALTAALNWYRAIPMHGVAGPVSVPTLYVWGTDDVAFGSTAAFATERFVSAPYRFEMLTDVGHWVPEQASGTLGVLVAQHLRTHRG